MRWKLNPLAANGQTVPPVVDLSSVPLNTTTRSSTCRSSLLSSSASPATSIMDPIGPGNHDRAWNDPPKFAFDAGGRGGGGGGVGGRRRLLNKRVPVPIGPPNTTVAGSPPTQPILKAGDPPPTIGPSPLRPPTTSLGRPSQQPPPVQPCEGVREAAGKSSEEMLEEVEAALTAALSRAAPSLKDSVREEVSRRLGVMRDMWVRGQLSPPVHHRMTALASAVVLGDYDRAWGLHQGLIVDYTSLCSPWMVAIKTLIAECRVQASTTAEGPKAGKGEETKERKGDVPKAWEGEEIKKGDAGEGKETEERNVDVPKAGEGEEIETKGDAGEGEETKAGDDSTSGGGPLDEGVEALSITGHQQAGHTGQAQEDGQST